MRIITSSNTNKFIALVIMRKLIEIKSNSNYENDGHNIEVTFSQC